MPGEQKGGLKISVEQIACEKVRRLDVYSHWGPIPRLVLRSSGLSLGAKAVYAYLNSFVSISDVKNGELKAWPSRRRMERELGISAKTLSKYLNELREKGLIEVEQSIVVRDGRSVYGNNIYSLRRYVDLRCLDGGDFVTEVVDNCRKENWPSGKFYASDEGHTNNNNALYNTRSLTTHMDPNKISSPRAESDAAEQEQEGRDYSPVIDDLLVFWNGLGVYPHQRLGTKTRERIGQALSEALEDFTLDELKGAMKTYAQVYHDRRCDHRYRLVEFLEKRGYEHFMDERNWRRGETKAKYKREDFLYGNYWQDRSMFSFLDDDPADPKEGEAER